jgi:hypothetical protein
MRTPRFNFLAKLITDIKWRILWSRLVYHQNFITIYFLEIFCYIFILNGQIFIQSYWIQTTVLVYLHLSLLIYCYTSQSCDFDIEIDYGLKFNLRRINIKWKIIFSKKQILEAIWEWLILLGYYELSTYYWAIS